MFNVEDFSLAQIHNTVAAKLCRMAHGICPHIHSEKSTFICSCSDGQHGLLTFIPHMCDSWLQESVKKWSTYSVLSENNLTRQVLACVKLGAHPCNQNE